MYYTAENTSIADYDLYTPAGPNAKINKLLFIPNKIKEDMLEMKDLNRHITMFSNYENLKNWITYSVPIWKNYEIALLPEYN